MQLKEVEIIDMGPHTHIHVKNIEGLMGIMGPNGKGKSVVLACLQAAMTSIWPGTRPAATYVRNAFLELEETELAELPEDPEACKAEKARRKKEAKAAKKEQEAIKPSNGSVRVVFEINGVEVESYRREGKSPAVWLQSSELPEKLTSVAAITDYLTKLYGADLRAIVEAAFVTQGTLDKIFAGTVTERLTHFMKILNLHYLERRISHLDGKIQFLQKNVVDMSGAEDALNEERKVASEAVSKLSSEYAGLVDRSEVRRRLATIADLQNRFDEKERVSEENMDTLPLRQAIDVWRDKKQEAEAHLKSLQDVVLANFGGQSLEQGLEALRIKLSDLQSKLAELTVRAEAVRSLEERKLRLQTKKSELEEASATLANIDGEIIGHSAALKEHCSLDVIPNNLSDLETRLRGILESTKEYNRTVDILDTYKADIVRMASSNLPELEAKLKEAHQVAREKLADQEAELKQLMRFESVIRPAVEHSKCPADANGKCLQCGLRLSENNAATQEDLDSIVARIQTLKQSIASTNSQAAQAAADLAKILEQQKQDIQLKSRIEQLQQTEKKLAEQADSRILNNWDSIASALSSLQQCSRKKAQEEQRVSSLRQFVQEEEQTLKDASATPISQEALQAAQQEVATTKELYQSWYNWGTSTFSPAAKGVQVLASRYEQLSTRLHTLTTALAAEEGDFQEKCLGLLSAEEWSLWQQKNQEGNLARLRESVEVTETRRVEARSQLMQAQEHSQGLESRWNAMQQKIADSNRRKQLIEELRDARSILKKDGAPTKFVQSKFSVMIPLINEKLNTLGASFTIREKMGQPCDFEFMEKSSEHNMWLPQTALSGGQAVRVTVAFLLSIQQVLTPNFGFLQLDEPSNHQDQNGVIGLRDFLMDLPTMVGGHIQCVLVDHHEELKSVVKSKLLLPVGQEEI